MLIIKSKVCSVSVISQLHLRDATVKLQNEIKTLKPKKPMEPSEKLDLGETKRIQQPSVRLIQSLWIVWTINICSDR